VNFNLLEICDAVSGQLIGVDAEGARTILLHGVSTDTRSLARGQLFVAIRGDRFDGHDFVVQAEASGAAACLIEDRPAESRGPVILVPDTVLALGALASACRARFPGPVVAITGSNGKTTTKEMCARILDAAAIAVRRTPGNLNNHIGLPLSILGLEPRDRALVVEMGMNHPGEIDILARIAQPGIGAITQVAAAHLGPMGSLEAIALAKGELLEHIDPKGCAILNADDANVMGQAHRFGGKCLTFGIDAEADYRAVGDVDLGRFQLLAPGFQTTVELPTPGRHLVLDALCAAACAHQTGLLTDPAAAIREGLEGFQALPGRLTLGETTDGIRLLDDSYNANPASVRAAISTLKALAGDARSLVTLGDILELGPEAPTLHEELGRFAAEQGVYAVIGVGELAHHAVAGARAAGLERAIEAEDAAAAARQIRSWARRGDIVLIKGSRGSRMERVAAELEQT